MEVRPVALIEDPTEAIEFHPAVPLLRQVGIDLDQLFFNSIGLVGMRVFHLLTVVLNILDALG